jgi:hypothetical protein
MVRAMDTDYDVGASLAMSLAISPDAGSILTVHGTRMHMPNRVTFRVTENSADSGRR